MRTTYRVIVVAVLLCAIGAVLVIKGREQEGEPVTPPVERVDPGTDAVAEVEQSTEAHEALPRLVDLGAGKCVPCKMMAPILDELKEEYASTLEVEFIDVWENPKAAEEYGIRMIPTQIFYDAAGKELFRHEGFFSKEEILATLKEQGVDVPVKEEG